MGELLGDTDLSNLTVTNIIWLSGLLEGRLLARLEEVLGHKSGAGLAVVIRLVASKVLFFF